MGAARIAQSRRFSTTRWSVILAAGRAQTPQTRDALSTLCAQYWYPLYAFARARGHGADEASDLTQGFLTRLLEKNDLASLGPGRGRFRSWLLASFKHFLANEWDRSRAQKRGGDVVEFSIDAEAAEGRFRVEPADHLTPEKVFARRWTLTLLDAVKSRLQTDCLEAGKEALFAALEGTLGGEAPVDYAALAPQLGMTPGALKVAAFRLRRRFGELLRAEILQTLERPEELDDEIRGLFAALGDGL